MNELVAEQHAEALVIDCSVYNMSESVFDNVRNDPTLTDLPIVIISDTPELCGREPDRARNVAKHVMLIP